MHRLLVFLLFLAASVLTGSPAFAQGVPGLPTAEEPAVETLLEQARKDGYRIILVPPESAAGAEAPRPTHAGDLISLTAVIERKARAARAKLVSILAELPRFPGHVAETISKRAGDGTTWWPVLAIALAAVFLGVGYGVGRLLGSWMRERFRGLYRPDPETRSERISYLIVSTILRSASVVVQVLIAGVLVAALGPESPPWRTTMVLTILAVGIARVAVLVFEGLIAPDAGSHRLINLSDADARSLFRGFVTAIWIAVPVGAICITMDLMGIDRDAHTLMLVAATLVSAILFAMLALTHSGAVAGAIMGREPEKRGVLLRSFARSWHGLALVYVLGAWSVTAVRLLLDQPGALGLIMAPILYGVLALSVYAVALLLIDRVFERRTALALAEGTEGPPETSSGLKHLAEHATALFLIAAYILLVVDAWFGVSLSGNRVVEAINQIVIISFLAYIAFQAVKVKIDDRIAAEGGNAAGAEPGDEGGAAGKASRLATLLPIFRNFLLAVIAAIAGMVVLSELGVDIAPLFAGAGVVGIAVGFGAQTLIRDIFSGAFFLMDDAFRRGEYIEIGGTRGTVEKISVRSMQLRHHLGPLHTIPFGEITSLTNYSRDWVMMKLPLRLTYDTDPEVVRKLIKQLGKELLEHPEIGDKFLEPLKSQGVYQMEDSAMIVRVKFMTKPGNQFPVRKVVYAKIRELFEQHGIRFANREVTVRIADNPERPLTPEEKEEVTGAVRPVLDEELTPAAGGETDQR